MYANEGKGAWRVNDYTGGVSGGEFGNQHPSAAAVDFNTADMKGQVLEVRDGGRRAFVFVSKKSHFICAVYVCVRETDAGVAGAPSPDK